MTTLETAATPHATPGSPRGVAAVRERLRKSETTLWRRGTLIAAVLPFVGLLFTIIVIAIKGWPAILVNGTNFFTGSSWNPGSTYGASTTVHGVAVPVGASYGAWPLILGTVESSAIALILAIPISLGAALALTERLPRIVSRPVGFAVELLAGIPSVLFGLWGIVTLGPLLAQHVYPPIANLMLSVMGAFAEFERSLLKERQREGIEIAKKKGLFKGRKQSLSEKEVIELRNRVANGEKKSDLAKEFQICRETLYKYIRQ